MSFIRFESASEKEKIREELRDARNQLLEKAKINAELRENIKVQKKLSGESDWMLPTVSAKLDKLNKRSKVSKKKKKEKKSKKSKKSSRKRNKCSSSSDETTDTDTSSERCSSGSHKKSKRKKQTYDLDDYSEKKSRKIKSKNVSTEKSTDSEGEWVEKKIDNNALPNKNLVQRDSWMTDTLLLKTYSRERVEKKINQLDEQSVYDPSKSARELNPYWKSTGTGLPSFQKPKDSSDEDTTDQILNKNRRHSQNTLNKPRNWQKKVPEIKQINDSKLTTSQIKSALSPSSTDSNIESDAEAKEQNLNVTDKKHFLTDQQMNELGAKILKAEIMGNMDLAADLKSKMELARANRNVLKNTKVETHNNTKKQQCKEEHVLLTHTDEHGNFRPLAQSLNADGQDISRDKGYIRKRQQKRVETHKDGQRIKYFPDDDKYDIKQMFEREKYVSSTDSNLQFANIASKHKNPQDDLDDIFADKIRKDISKETTDKKELQKAINEHRKLTTRLENCDRCFDSDKMDKKLVVSMGENVYLALPWYIGIQTGHCVIVPTQHVSCSTQLDEDVWEEIENFRKALTRMFYAQKKDVIFFEIANNLHRKPHLGIHCIPIDIEKGENAPFYFKKAIEESEHEWSINKQLVSLRDKGLRKSIPKGLPYLWVNFGMDSGFAHIIEDQNRFPDNFALEIIGGMLHLAPSKWRKPQKEQNVIPKVKIFADWWKKYDCT